MCMCVFEMVSMKLYVCVYNIINMSEMIKGVK